MQRNECKVGMKVYFGRPSGEKTLGEVIKTNPKSAKVKTLEARGDRRAEGVWNVDYSFLTPAGDAPVRESMETIALKLLELWYAAQNDFICTGPLGDATQAGIDLDREYQNYKLAIKAAK